MKTNHPSLFLQNQNHSENMIIPHIETIAKKKLIGKSLTMSFSNNRTSELWQSFMSRRKEIQNAVGTDLFNIQIYENLNPFEDFNPEVVFEKWASIEVTDFNSIPAGMEAFTLQEGLYAVFDYKGNSPEIFQNIFQKWIPNSGYELAHRPHFEVLGEKYKNNDPDSEEEIWIPIQKKLPRRKPSGQS
jgi:AraC family transcriptional regulator